MGLEVANGVSATVPCSKTLKLYSTEFQGAISFRNWIDLAPVFPAFASDVLLVLCPAKAIVAAREAVIVKAPAGVDVGH